MAESERELTIALASSMFFPDIGGTQVVIHNLAQSLQRRGHTPIAVVGFSRREYSHDDFRQFVRDVFAATDHNHDEETVEAFCQRLYFKQGNFDVVDDYRALDTYLHEFEDEWGQCINKLLYLAVPPSFYETIFENIGQTSLPEECSGDTGFSRVIVEKPFGSDLETARQLDRKLDGVFREEQIFRIDHYLGKDAVQNLLTFRFTNVLFENSWSADDIESVHIRMFEDIGVEDRGEFYDSVGALRDVGQNHVLQMLALTAMESPGKLEAGVLRAKREELLRSLVPIETADDVAANTVRGQYDGYRDIDGVADDSDTETYFKLRAYVDNERWKGVPFYLEAGKQMGEKKVDITVTFKAKVPCVCGRDDDHEHKNVLTTTLQPAHGVNMRFWVKEPGLAFDLAAKDLSFALEESELRELVPDAYEKLLFDCIQGDQTLFVSTAEVEAAWRFITPIVEHWQESERSELVKYKQGHMPNTDLRFTI